MHTAKLQYTGIFTIGGVSRSAKDRGKGCGQTITDQGAVQTGIRNKILTDGS